MKSKMITVVTAVMGMVSATAISAAAQEAQYTDIGAYINNYPISAYAVDGKLAVVAEDLRDYGFNVEWDADNWALHISRNNAVTNLKRKDVYKPSQASGVKFSDIYSSGINVDYNGVPMESYALNGYTLVTVNDLAALAGSEQWDAENRAYKVWVDGLSSCEYMPLTQRCRNLWYSIDYKNMPTIDLWEDFDSDGSYDHLVFGIIGTNKYGGIKAQITVNGNKSGNIYEDVWDAYNIEAVYLMDIVPNDGVKELAVFTIAGSDDPVLQIFRLTGTGSSSVNFHVYDRYEGVYEDTDILGTGYVDAYPLNLHDDGSFTVQQQTSSTGMWDIYVTYRLDDYGSLVRINQDVYTVVPKTWGYGVNPWGYYPVYESVYGRGLTLKAGDYIMPVYDDGNNNIYIRKSNGSEGWFSIDSYHYSSGSISPMFVMAD